ncbi:MAG: hypothetical protein J2P54_02520 [Bradyrhizobiaceae bacterium]|nr:hypothetical protein [Bradyrhizobiaceae bacterium]
MRDIFGILGIIGISAVLMASPVHALEPDELPLGYPLGLNAPLGFANEGGRVATGSPLGVDTIPTFESYFYDPGFNANGIHQYTWQYRMVGRTPVTGGENDNGDDTPVTRIRAPVIPVTVDLRNFDGSPRFVNGQPLISSPAAYVAPTLASPIFQPAGYSSSFTLTQFTDSIMRAEFYGVASQHWHTLLDPSAKPGLTMVLLAGTYRFALNSDGTCCAFILVDRNTFRRALFPAGGPTTVIAQAIAAGYITTQDISTFLFPNTLLYWNGDVNQCCTPGFHNYAVAAGDQSNGWKERRYVFNYSSWMTAGVYRNWADVAVLSHELSETFNDPFLGNVVPWWLAPNGNCRNDLETGDVIERLPNAMKLIDMGGTAYHVQNEALLQWFAGQTPSTAINGAYSYPDPVLTTPSVSQNVGCLAEFDPQIPTP